MARRITPDFLLRKSMRFINRHLTQLNRKLKDGVEISGNEANAAASYARLMNSQMKAERDLAEKRQDKIYTLSNEEIIAKAKEILTKQAKSKDEPAKQEGSPNVTKDT